MALETYRKKRNFAATPEPRRQRRAAATGHSFVIQKHDARGFITISASRLDGVLKSWAVTRGPSLVPGEKRLAVHVEDHPLEYGDLRGHDPEGRIWRRRRHRLGPRNLDADRRRRTRATPRAISISSCTGEKLDGPLASRPDARQAARQARELAADQGRRRMRATEDAPDILEERPESAKTGRGRSRRSPARRPAGRRRRAGSREGARRRARARAAARSRSSKSKGAKKAPLPDFVEPMLATLGQRAAGRRPMAARDQVRRLSARGAHRERAA